MSIINAIILGLVQGITEFIPISSSGHLVIVAHLLHLSNAFTFDTLLNIGSLLALIVYYRKKIWSIIVRAVKGREWPLILKIIAACIPAVIIGLLFDSQISALNDMVWVVTVAMLIVGLLMVVFGHAEASADDREIEKSVDWPTAGKIGLAQTFALIPGVSRSGITILTGLRSRLSAAKAAEFSFLMAIPIIAGAWFLTLISHDGRTLLQHNLLAFSIGNIVCFIAGMLAINFLIKFIGRRGLKDFGWYRIILAILLIILLITGLLH